MDARVTLATTPDDLALAGRLLHEFNTAYDDPSPGAEALTVRLADLVGRGDTDVLLGDEHGVAVVRYRPSLWSEADEAYLAAGEVATEAARRLHLSVRAVTYRLGRIRELTGYDLSVPLDRLTLYNAVLGARLIGWPTDPIAEAQ